MEMQSSSSHHEAPDTSSVPPPPPPSDGAPLQDHALLPQSIEHSVAVQEAEMSEEEVKGTLEAAGLGETEGNAVVVVEEGMFRYTSIVLSEYPEAKITDEQQKEALGETYLQLGIYIPVVKAALLNFDEGPPFTLQRLCEILLAARSIYPKLSKLALALEKNLLVTSMLSISTDPQLETTENANAATEDTGTAAANWAQNGIEEAGGDKDEIMTEVEEADVDDAMTIDMETIDEPSETTTKASESEKPSETNAAEPSSDSMAAEEGDSRLP
ncbi:hypothetical protein HID58_004495 [Brassica napus]|uniref:Uncharacterized protein n=1 Tax=Brassica napus TaxID=3708 RepID=A0ABQ8E5Y3_BRANA|nr:hypothetical protein HID58_004495 [Brassica napus]